MAESYLERKKRKDDLEEQKNEIIFGLMGGVILMVAGALKWLTGTGFLATASIYAAGLGLILFGLAIVAPAALKYPYRAFRFFGNTVGKAAFAAMLTVLYTLLIFPVGLLLRRKREGQGYFTWDQTQPGPRSMFTDIWQADGPASKTGKASYFGIMYRLFSAFFTNRKFILIPVVVILVILGLILFFVSSNVVTAFIYTLF